MPKNKRPVPRKPVANPAEDDEVQAAALATLALALSEREHAEEDDAAVLDAQEAEFDKLLRNALRKRNDEVLYGAIEFARDDDVGAYQLLRSRIEEASATVLLRKEGAPAMEVNAFAVPLFVHSKGGLKDADTFQDGDAFSELVDSFSKLGLESPAAKVVLVSHAYDAIEAARITFSGLNDMARDAAASMTDKKLVATPALERSITGWAPSSFAEGDQAVELRFLVGFALKRADDPFYAVPDEAAAADAYFAARMERYRAWTEQAAPLLKRCLGRDPASMEIHFQYQDLFFGAYQQGMDELAERYLSDFGLQRADGHAEVEQRLPVRGKCIQRLAQLLLLGGQVDQLVQRQITLEFVHIHQLFQALAQGGLAFQQLLLIVGAHQEELAGGLEPGDPRHGLGFLQ